MPEQQRSRIKNGNSAQYNSVQQFLAMMHSDNNYPADTNLFSIYIVPPSILLKDPPTAINKQQDKDTLNSGKGNLRDLINYYARDINLPSKQMGTGSVTNAGSAYKYITNPTYSNFNINFMCPSSQQLRLFFERWMARCSNDANQYSAYYSDYISPRVLIFKWEKFGGDELITKGGKPTGSFIHKLTACWEIYNAFPYNIGSIQLNNDSAKTMTMTIGFNYERYRFFTDPTLDSSSIKMVTKPSNPDSDYTPSTSQNKLESEVAGKLFSGFPLSSSLIG